MLPLLTVVQCRHRLIFCPSACKMLSLYFVPLMPKLFPLIKWTALTLPLKQKVSLFFIVVSVRESGQFSNSVGKLSSALPIVVCYVFFNIRRVCYVQLHPIQPQLFNPRTKWRGQLKRQHGSTSAIGATCAGEVVDARMADTIATRLSIRHKDFKSSFFRTRTNGSTIFSKLRSSSLKANGDHALFDNS
ncbi:unnamed protein product [Sphenostylis stenocarpa]|uniref:Uncharacterized protein n=1 Tax=Sphenostylis stenocarpa TaxID=92480 RepID=A0AA86VP39_9FABA|nr:unnamed protein product [Sphenostylis stenocarpa]